MKRERNSWNHHRYRNTLPPPPPHACLHCAKNSRISLTFEANLVPLEHEHGVVVFGGGRGGDVQPQRQRDLGARQARARQPDPEHLQRDGHLSPGGDVHPGREQRHHPGADTPWNTYHVVIQLHRVRQLRTQTDRVERRIFSPNTKGNVLFSCFSLAVVGDK